MRILLYGLNYAPELTGIGKYSGELGAWLAGRGHEVRVITAPPYYPAWRVDEAYRATSYRIEHAPGQPTVIRVPLWVPAKPTGLKRMLHLLSFAVASAPVVMLQPLWQPDVILNIEPTFFSAPLGWFLARFCGARSWLHVQDFEVDAAFELGLLPAGGAISRAAFGLEAWFTRRFDRVSSISRPMLAKLAEKGVPEERRVLFPNWVGSPTTSHDAQGESAAADSLREHLGVADKVVVMYSGNLGMKQGLEVLAPLARSFSDDARVHFVFCGDGAYRRQLEAEVKGLANVSLLPLQPAERLSTFLRAADIHLLLQKAGAADLVMPSKLAGMLASGRAVLATADPGTEIAAVVEGRGLLTPPGDLQSLRQALCRLADDPGLRGRLGEAARLFAEEHLQRDNVLSRFEEQLIALVHEER